jgi:hypothetical protein
MAMNGTKFVEKARGNANNDDTYKKGGEEHGSL